MLQGHDIARLRRELLPDLASPRAVFEGLSQPSCLLNGRNVLPGLVVPRAISAMQRIKDADASPSHGLQDLDHMRYRLVGFSHTLQPIPHFAALGNKIVVRIEHQKPGHVPFIRQVGHVSSRH